MVSASAETFNELWHTPYKTYHRWIQYLRSCMLTVLSIPLLLVWLVLVEQRQTRFEIFQLLSSNVIFVVWIAIAAIPVLLLLVSIVTFIRLQLAKPSSKQQIIAIVAGCVPILALAGLVLFIVTALAGLSG